MLDTKIYSTNGCPVLYKTSIQFEYTNTKYLCFNLIKTFFFVGFLVYQATNCFVQDAILQRDISKGSNAGSHTVHVSKIPHSPRLQNQKTSQQDLRKQADHTHANSFLSPVLFSVQPVLPVSAQAGIRVYGHCKLICAPTEQICQSASF